MPPINPIITKSIEAMFTKKELDLIFLAAHHENRPIEETVRDILCFSPHIKVSIDITKKIQLLTEYQLQTIWQIHKEGLKSIVFAETYPVVQ